MVKVELDEKRTHDFMYGFNTKRKTLECVIAGRGDPHIVLLSGYGVGMDASWGKIFPQLKEMCRVIAYNRWGVGKSSSTRMAQNGLEVISVLRRLLTIEEVHAPYILVGHAIGGVYAQLFARLYPHEVAGMVLVDSSHHDHYTIRKEGGGLARRTFGNSELTNFEATAKQIREAPSSTSFPDVPLVVITPGMPSSSPLQSKKMCDALQENQNKLVSLSPKGRQVVATKSGHFVQNDEPEIVLQAIRDVVNDVRSNPMRTVPTPRMIHKTPI